MCVWKPVMVLGRPACATTSTACPTRTGHATWQTKAEGVSSGRWANTRTRQSRETNKESRRGPHLLPLLVDGEKHPRLHGAGKVVEHVVVLARDGRLHVHRAVEDGQDPREPHAAEQLPVRVVGAHRHQALAHVDQPLSDAHLLRGKGLRGKGRGTGAMVSERLKEAAQQDSQGEKHRNYMMNCHHHHHHHHSSHHASWSLPSSSSSSVSSSSFIINHHHHNQQQRRDCGLQEGRAGEREGVGCRTRKSRVGSLL